MKVFRENTPLKDNDICVVLDSTNNGFDYPIHNHPEIEINLILGMSGKRIVGDSTEYYYNQDLVIIGPYLYHKWYGDEALLASNKTYRVITIQFDAQQFNNSFIAKNSFISIRKLLKDCTQGIVYDNKTIEAASNIMIEMTNNKGFDNTISFLKLLDLLAKANDQRKLTYLQIDSKSTLSNNTRIQLAFNYIIQHYMQPNFMLKDVADKVQMSENAFSHFFHKHAFRSFSDFITDLRLSRACKLLLETDKTISEVCYESGYNNLANFNRLFKKYREYTPLNFRKKFWQDSNFQWDKQVTPWQFMPSNIQDMGIVKPKDFSTKIVHH